MFIIKQNSCPTYHIYSRKFSEEGYIFGYRAGFQNFNIRNFYTVTREINNFILTDQTFRNLNLTEYFYTIHLNGPFGKFNLKISCHEVIVVI